MSDAQPPQAPFQIQVIPVTPLQQNASIIWSTETREAAVVDPGGDADRLLDATTQLGVTVTAIWVTHGHIDHVGAVVELKEKFGCPIIGPHEDDQWLLDEVESSGAKYGIMGKNFTPDRYLSEGDTVALSGIEFGVLHCPGHSPGSIVLFNTDMKFAFVGDVLFRGSIGRTDLPRGDHNQLINSVVQKLWPLGDMHFLPGHGPASSFAQERLDNPFVGDNVVPTY